MKLITQLASTSILVGTILINTIGATPCNMLLLNDESLFSPVLMNYEKPVHLSEHDEKAQKRAERRNYIQNLTSRRENLSNESYSFCFRRMDNHVPSGDLQPININKYDAYYLDTNVTDDNKTVYLTFDVGYNYNDIPDRLMDVLKEHNIHATFFVTKQFVKTSPQMCKRMKREGHIVGNHTLNHPSIPSISYQQFKEEVLGLEELFRKNTGYEIDRFFRPPAGAYSERRLGELQDLGYTTIFWSIAYGDYDTSNQPGKTYVVNHFKRYHHNGAIILMHGISESNAEALDEVLTYLEDEGYSFGSLYDL